MSKRNQNYKVGIYLRFGDEVYTSFEEMERERRRRMAMSRMTPEQIEFCEKMKREFEVKNCLSVR